MAKHNYGGLAEKQPRLIIALAHVYLTQVLITLDQGAPILPLNAFDLQRAFHVTKESKQLRCPSASASG